MERMKEGDINALGKLVSRYQTSALRAAYLVTHELTLAEDVVSGAFLRVFERAQQYDPTRPFGPWFYRIVVNDAIKAVQRRDRTTTLDRAEDTGGRDESTDPEAASILNEERRAVREAQSSCGTFSICPRPRWSGEPDARRAPSSATSMTHEGV